MCVILCYIIVFFFSLSDLPEDKVPIVLAPLLYPEQQQQSLTTLTPGVISMPKSMVSVIVFSSMTILN